MILTTEALITDLPEKEKAAVPAIPEYQAVNSYIIEGERSL
jgi:hypothetical protein